MMTINIDEHNDRRVSALQQTSAAQGVNRRLLHRESTDICGSWQTSVAPTVGCDIQTASRRPRPLTNTRGSRQMPKAADRRSRQPTDARGNQRTPEAADGRPRQPTDARGSRRTPEAADGRPRQPTDICHHSGSSPVVWRLKYLQADCRDWEAAVSVSIRESLPPVSTRICNKVQIQCHTQKRNGATLFSHSFLSHVSLV